MKPQFSIANLALITLAAAFALGWVCDAADSYACFRGKDDGYHALAVAAGFIAGAYCMWIVRKP